VLDKPDNQAASQKVSAPAISPLVPCSSTIALRMRSQRAAALGSTASEWLCARVCCPDAHISTYQAHPVACAAALAVQEVIEEDNLLENVRTQGAYLEKLLREKTDASPLLSQHVADIRGKGLLWGMCACSQSTEQAHSATARLYRT
jgi:4-aminobutyrate aminotransferase-like enzyme